MRHDASRGPSAIADLIVLLERGQTDRLADEFTDAAASDSPTHAVGPDRAVLNVVHTFDNDRSNAVASILRKFQ